MKTRIATALFLVVSSVTGARAQTELPNQWLDQQLRAAQQDRSAQGRSAVTALNPAATTPVVTPTGAGKAPAASTQQPSRLEAATVSNTVPAQK